VRQHFNLDVNRVTYVNTRAATTACVDSRHEYPVIGTPGGDMCEFIVGLTVYLNQTGQTLSQVRVLGCTACPSNSLDRAAQAADARPAALSKLRRGGASLDRPQCLPHACWSMGRPGLGRTARGQGPGL
jgi:hypothetical protein